MAPFAYDDETYPATPSEYCWAIAPSNAGYSDVLGQGFRLMPTFWQKAVHTAGDFAAMYAVNCAVVPEPSERITGRTARCGSGRPGLVTVTAGSSQNLMTPVKILATASPLRFSDVTRFPLMSRWYMNEVPPATIGMYA